MAKGKRKLNSSDSLVPPQRQSLRSRDCPSDEIYQTDGVQVILHQQDMEGSNTTRIASPLQRPQSPLQECAMIANQLDQAAGQSCLTKQDDSKEEKHVEKTNVYLKNVMVRVFERQEETTVTSSNNDSELEDFRVNPDHDTNKSGMEEITPQEGIRSPSETSTHQLFLPTSEEDDGSCASALKKQLGTKENSQCNLERDDETSQEEPCNMCMAHVKEITTEAAAGIPAKKKRRMGMCGLTEKERSNFLQTQKRTNGQIGTERAEKQVYNSNTADIMAQEEVLSSLHLPASPVPIPIDRTTEQREAEIKLQSSHCGEDNRAEAEDHIAVATSNGTSTVCDPGCSEGKSGEAEGSIEPGPEQTVEPRSDPPSEDEVGEHFGNEERQEVDRSTIEIMTKTPEKQRKGGENRVEVEVDCSPAISSHTNPTQNEETEKKKNGSETKASDEWKEDTRVDANDGAEAEGTSSTGCNCGSVELCEAAVTPTGSKRKESCDPGDEPGPSAVNAEHTQTRDTTDPFGSGCLDYVSDSQLNTIVLIEEEVMKRKEDPGSADCHEDATDLVCGLIRELSSLNQKVMATHRELENLRRGSKSSRSSMR